MVGTQCLNLVIWCGLPVLLPDGMATSNLLQPEKQVTKIGIVQRTNRAPSQRRRKEGGRRERHMMSVQPVASVSPAEGCTFLEHKSCVYWEHLAADKPYACSTGRRERPGGQRQAILLSISWAVCIHPLSLTNTWRKKLQAFYTFYHQVQNAYRRSGKWFCLCPQFVVLNCRSNTDPNKFESEGWAFSL